jgi:hypothetical protein
MARREHSVVDQIIKHVTMDRHCRPQLADRLRGVNARTRTRSLAPSSSSEDGDVRVKRNYTAESFSGSVGLSLGRVIGTRLAGQDPSFKPATSEVGREECMSANTHVLSLLGFPSPPLVSYRKSLCSRRAA